MSEQATAADAAVPSTQHRNPWRSFRLWMVMIAMSFAIFLSAMDMTSVSTALPVISNDLGLTDFIWVGSSYSLAATVILPLFGSFAMSFGRRTMLSIVILLFAAGSAISGSASNQAAMISGRVIQGLGGGGIVALTDILITDLFPLSLRGQAYGIFGMVWAFAAAIGPPIGGALADSDWRWLFYMNLPLCGVALVLVLVYCDLHFPSTPVKDRIRRFDFAGNAVFIAGSTAIVLAFTWAGNPFGWKSAAVLVPLLVGLAVLVLFGFIERKAIEPAVPSVLVNNRTSSIGYASTCIHSIVVLPLIYYYPVYFQAVKQTSAVRSGINIFPISFTVAPFSIMAGFFVAWTKRYKELNVASWAMMALGFGLMCLLEPDSSTGIWAGIPVIIGIPAGILYTVTLFPVAAPLPVDLGAQMMAFYGFAQNFGTVLGITMGGVILQNDLPHRLPIAVSSQLEFSADAAFALIPIIPQLPPDQEQQAKQAVNDSLRIVWIACAAFSALGMAVSLWMKALPLPEEKDERYGLREKGKQEAQGADVELNRTA